MINKFDKYNRAIYNSDMPTTKPTQTAPVTPSFSLSVSVGRSQYGTATPKITVTAKGGTFRHLNAKLHQVAALVELASADRDPWCVTTTEGCQRGEVALELATGSDAEATLGMALLTRIVKEAK